MKSVNTIKLTPLSINSKEISPSKYEICYLANLTEEIAYKECVV